MARKKRAVLEMGYDSFLDIVANLVGILIILVVVLGAQSRQVAVEAARESVKQSQEVRAYEQSLAESLAAREAVDQLRVETARYELEIESRRHERAMLMDLLTMARDKWDEEKAALSDDQREAARLSTEMSTRKKKLEKLAGEKSRLENVEPEVAVVEHLPSPMAKTVFGDEIHLRLSAGRLSVVPIESLVEEIRTAFQRGVDGLQPGVSRATVGPVRGFLAEYEVQRSRATVSRGGSIGTAVRMELTGMVIRPTPEHRGQPLEEVLAGSRSMLDIELAGRLPETTTVTVWVYPDSFAEFRSLKEHLYARGVATAARPLPEGQPISGGPNGSRSAAQ